MISLRNIRFPVCADYDLKREISKKLKASATSFELVEISRIAVDCRRKGQPVYDISVVLDIPALKHPDASPYLSPEEPLLPPIQVSDQNPFIIGMGPAGLFCALEMVENGFQPWLFDKGGDLESRAKDVTDFWENSILNESSNVQYGEGGAGAFSDGKLTSRARDWSVRKVFERFIEHGADPSITYEALPHLGTDGIRQVVASIRDHLIAKGCRFHYHQNLNDITIMDGRVASVKLNAEVYQPETVFLALGNSARDTLRMLHNKGVAMEAKPFAVGFRIEHRQDFINQAIYGSEKWVSILGPATYRLANGDTYTFCMCPGGYIINAASEKASIVTNGMSFSKRDHLYANSAVVSVVNEDIYGSGVFAGLEFQERIERLSYQESYSAPAQRVEDFVKDSQTYSSLQTSFTPGVYCRKLSTILPSAIETKIKSALHKFDSTIHGFSRDGVCIAPETRTSSPVRILRQEHAGNCLGVSNLYFIGEGSGYSGGIVSSAADGYRLGTRLRFQKK